MALCASFNASNITDNDKINFKVVSVTPAGVSSSFNIGGTTTTFPVLGTNENKIEVVATKIDFVTVPTTASINVSFPVVTHARDANNNLDKDYNGTISFTGTGNTSGYSVANPPAGPFIAGVLNYPLGYYFTTGTTLTQLTINGALVNSGGESEDAGAIMGISPPPGIDVKTSYDSWLYFDPSFAYTTRIPYVTMQETTLTNTANSVELARLVLSDGGAPGSTFDLINNPNPGVKNMPFGQHNDIDGAFTKIDQFTISLTNFADIRKIALFDALGNKIGSDQNAAATVTFNGLSGVAALTASDNDVAKFYIRASFNSTIGADLNQVNIQITDVVWSSGSQFPLTDGISTEGGIDGAGTGGDSSDPAQNFIDIVATSLDFVTAGSLYAGTNEPLGVTYTTSPLPSTSAAVVHARNKFAQLDPFFHWRP